MIIIGMALEEGHCPHFRLNGEGGAHAPGVPLLLPPMLCSFVYTSYARILIKLLVIVIGQSIFGNP